MNKHILVITYYWPPSGGAGVQRWLKFCKYLPNFGMQPIVLTVDEHQASYPQRDDSLLEEVSNDLRVVKTKTKEVLRFYRHLSPTGELPHTGFGNEKHPTLLQKISRFIRGNFFLPDPRRGWNKYAYKEACHLIEEENITTVITTSPPHSTQLIGLRLKRQYPHIKWVADLRDPWTDIYYNKDLYQTIFAKLYNARLERKVLESADEVITVSEECRRNFESKTHQTLAIQVIPNGYDETDFLPEESSKKTDKFILSYVGSLSPLYETKTFIAALQQLPQAVKDKIKLRFVGSAHADLASLLNQVGIETEWLGYAEHKKAIGYMQEADMLLLFLPNQPENKGILTGKLFEYMATGKPILMIGFGDGDAAQLLRKYEEDGIYEFGQATQVSQFIARSLTTLPSIHTDFAQIFSRQQLTKQLAQLLPSV